MPRQLVNISAIVAIASVSRRYILQAFFAPRQKMGGKIHCRQQHEHDEHEFDGGRIEIADTGIVRGKSAQPHRRKSMADRIKPVHAGQP